MRRLLLALLPLAAQAEVVAQSPSGPVEIVSAGDGERQVAVGGWVVPNTSAYLVGVERQLGNLFLLALATGGNGCPSLYAWLDTTPGRVRASETFGTCSDLPDVSWDSETVTVEMPSMDPERPERVRFLWDVKGAVREVSAGLPSLGIGTLTAAALEGRHVGEVMLLAEADAPLSALLGRAALADARRLIAVADARGMTRFGGWVAGGGCMAHDCGRSRGALALHEDGRILVALNADGMVRLWGDARGELPGPVLDVLRRD